MTLLMLLLDAWYDWKWRSNRYLGTLKSPSFKETYVMYRNGKSRILLKFEH